jgi:hypothetical protein
MRLVAVVVSVVSEMPLKQMVHQKVVMVVLVQTI